MPINRTSPYTATAIAFAAVVFTPPALAQDDASAPMSAQDVQDLPPEMQRAPRGAEAGESSTIGPDGVETITSTRRIKRPTPGNPAHHQGYVTSSHAPAAVMERAQWIEECERRANGRSDGKRGERYDCAAALDSYLSQYGHGPARIAHRTIPAPRIAYPAYGHSYNYAPPPQITYVPIRYEQQQRVVVRETVREEIYQVPGAARIIEKPAPSPKMIKQ